MMSLVEIKNVTKRFPGVVANDDISLTINSGEIQTFLGENGAGKSTLMQILAGMLQPDEGRLYLSGQEIKLESPQAALEHGIAAVYQHFTLVPTLSVIENVILGTNQGFMLNLGQAEQHLQELLKEFKWPVSPRTEIRYLSIGQQQRVEIIKALYRGSQVLLLDEPTAVLTPPEVKELFAILRRLKAKGVGIVFVTHKLDEALEISDRITVLRQGRKVAEFVPGALEPGRAALSQQIVATMFGGDSLSVKKWDARSDLLAQPDGPVAPTSGPVIYSLREVAAVDDRGALAVQEVSLQLRAGEIFGIAGVDGNGQKELAEVMAGQRGVIKGQVMLAGFDLTQRGVAAAKQAGVGYVSDDRLGEGSVTSLTVAENAVLNIFNQPPFSHFTWLNRAAIVRHTRHLIQAYHIKTTGPEARLGTLSGGNIQKLLLARELARQPKILICNKPTQGLDVLTTHFILQTLRAQASKGVAVVLISSELVEILTWSDRVGVMVKGRLVELIGPEKEDREMIGRLMLGLQNG